MRLHLLAVTVSLACGRTELPEDAANGSVGGTTGTRGAAGSACSTERVACTREAKPTQQSGVEWLKGTCPAGLACIPEDETCKGPCAGRCVALALHHLNDGTTRVNVYGHCPACGPCSFVCWGSGGFECPLNCSRMTGGLPFVFDSSSSCEVE